VTYLRKKIEPDPSRPRYIVSQRGHGYRFRGLAGPDGRPAGQPPRVGALTAAP
jgi:hypothetical protein